MAPSRQEVEVLCPRCKVPMNFYSTSERSSKGNESVIRVTRYYKCPVCGRTIVSEELTIRVSDGGATITRRSNGLDKVAIIRPLTIRT